jgi:hypothetical protein
MTRVSTQSTTPLIDVEAGRVAAIAAELGSLIDAMIGEHETMLSLCEAHMTAIRVADHQALGEVVGRQTHALQRIAELDGARADIVNVAMNAITPKPASPTLSAIAQALPGSTGTELLSKAQRLRTVMQRLANEQNVVRLTTRALLAHMEGLMRQVARELSHAGTYGRKGYVENGAAVVSALDIRS